MNAPVISVVLPVYNASAYIEEAIESILRQSFTDFELLIINDGSTDNSAEKISSFKDQRIRIITNEKNLGLIDSLNKGVALAKGKYIARMDADDHSHPERFAMQISFMENNPEIGLCGSFMSEYGQNQIVRHRFLRSEYIKPAFLFTNPVVHPSAFIRRELFTHNSYDKKYRHAEDYAFWISLLPQTEFGVIPEALLGHRKHQGQVSVLFSELQKEAVKKAQEILFSYLGIIPSEAEKEIHFCLFLETYRKEKNWIAEVEIWLLKLIEGNNKTAFFSHIAFNNIIGEIWFRVNQELSKSGNANYKRFRKSELSEGYSPSAKSKIRLAMRSLLSLKK